MFWASILIFFKDCINNVWVAIRNGNRKVAGHFVNKGVEKFGFGFNFLHKEVRKTLVSISSSYSIRHILRFVPTLLNT